MGGPTGGAGGSLLAGSSSVWGATGLGPRQGPDPPTQPSANFTLAPAPEPRPAPAMCSVPDTPNPLIGEGAAWGS